jgi:hypothetical protein
MINVDWLSASTSVRVGGAVLLLQYLSFSPVVSIQFANLPAHRKRGPEPEERSQTLLTNKNHGYITKYTPLRKIRGAPKNETTTIALI